LACPERKRRWRGRPGAARIAAAPGRAEQRGGRRKEGGEGEADQWDPAVSERKEKKRRGRRHGLARGVADGPLGQKGREVSFSLFYPFFKPFSNILLNSNSNQISFKLFTKFYKLFNSHTSNQKPCKAK
jgi:hypothetical protein